MGQKWDSGRAQGPVHVFSQHFVDERLVSPPCLRAARGLRPRRQPQERLEFSRHDRVLSRFQPTQMSRQTRTMNGSEFVEAQRRADFEMRALKLRCREIDDEIGRQRLRGKDR